MHCTSIVVHIDNYYVQEYQNSPVISDTAHKDITGNNISLLQMKPQKVLYYFIIFYAHLNFFFSSISYLVYSSMVSHAVLIENLNNQVFLFQSLIQMQSWYMY